MCAAWWLQSAHRCHTIGPGSRASNKTAVSLPFFREASVLLVLPQDAGLTTCGTVSGFDANHQDAPVPKVRKERDEIEMDEDVLSQLRRMLGPML